MSHDALPLHTASYRVRGMTCQHCVDAVTGEVAAVPGVRSVEIDLAAGSLRVTSAPEVARSAVADAVDEAGYVLADF